jgi:hypothetical protein
MHVKALFDSLTSLHQIKFDYKQPRLTDEDLWGIKLKNLKYHVLWVKKSICNPYPTASPSFSKLLTRSENVNPHARQVIAQQVHEEKDRGIIHDSCSPYSSTVLLGPTADGGVRFCVDFRELNRIVRRDTYPLPRIGDSLAALHGNKLFSSLDIVTAFWQVPLTERNRGLTVFRTPDHSWSTTACRWACARHLVSSRISSMDEVFAGLN